MEIFSDTKVYIICPANINSGGPELCHQFVSQLLQFGVDAYVFYLPNKASNFNTDNPVDKFYVKYHVPYVLKAVDNPKNILILNESANEFFALFKRIRKIIWWMSVDNYLNNLSNIILNHKNNAALRPLTRFFYFDPADKSTEHWVQSEYARKFITLNGIEEGRIYTVGDYLSQAFLGMANKINLAEKENLVAFNPVKGFEVTQELIKLAPDIDWRPIQNMSPAQVQNLLASAKVYIDFGNHPGKDRIPREAAISGCVVITGKRGAAANNIDINIPPEFKFSETTADLPKIIDKIHDVFKNFDANYAKQNEYRTRILDDKNRFAREVAAAFSLNTAKIPDTFAVAQGLTSRGSYLATIFSNANSSMKPDFIIDDEFCRKENAELPFIRRKNNNNFFVTKSDTAREILIISTDDAKFLYAEGRIKKFILYAPTQTELDDTAAKFNLDMENILVANPNN